MRNEEKARNYSDDGKSAMDNALEKLKSNKYAKIGTIALGAFIVISILLHFFA